MISGGLDDQRERIAQFAYDLIRLRLDEVTPDVLAAEAGTARHRLEVLFPDEADLFEAVAELWFRPLTAMMEEVLASDLPANRKMYEFFARRFVHLRRLHGEEPAFFRLTHPLAYRPGRPLSVRVDRAGPARRLFRGAGDRPCA
jgi:TetR/AcrR family transcriptional regulator, repressor of the ameABC operon